jgi:hypothetical protein
MDHFVAGLDHRHHGEEHDWLSAGNDDDLFCADPDVPRPRDVGRNRLAEVRESARRSVSRPPFVERALACLDDVRWRWEIGLADFQVDDASTLRFEGARAGEHLEGGLRPNPGHAISELHAIDFTGLRR